MFDDCLKEYKEKIYKKSMKRRDRVNARDVARGVVFTFIGITLTIVAIGQLLAYRSLENVEPVNINQMELQLGWFFLIFLAGSLSVVGWGVWEWRWSKRQQKISREDKHAGFDELREFLREKKLDSERGLEGLALYCDRQMKEHALIKVMSLVKSCCMIAVFPLGLVFVSIMWDAGMQNVNVRTLIIFTLLVATIPILIMIQKLYDLFAFPAHRALRDDVEYLKTELNEAGTGFRHDSLPLVRTRRGRTRKFRL
ncbi:MAG: hypothetical protein FWE28_07020 [Oscillospiraceae bacterium]|nr:hypothetical protein [Oscillospiraceae bacterium]